MMESCKKEADEQKKMLAMAVPKFGDFWETKEAGPSQFSEGWD
jgi:hypothetical protein